MGFRGSLFYENLLGGAIVEDEDVQALLEGGLAMAVEGVDAGGKGVGGEGGDTFGLVITISGEVDLGRLAGCVFRETEEGAELGSFTAFRIAHVTIECHLTTLILEDVVGSYL